MDQLAGQMLKIMQKRLADRLTRELSKWGDLNEESINIQNLVKDGSISLDGMTLQHRDLAGVGLRVKGGLIKQLSIKILRPLPMHSESRKDWVSASISW